MPFCLDCPGDDSPACCWNKPPAVSDARPPLLTARFKLCAGALGFQLVLAALIALAAISIVARAPRIAHGLDLVQHVPSAADAHDVAAAGADAKGRTEAAAGHAWRSRDNARRASQQGRQPCNRVGAHIGSQSKQTKS